MRQCGERLLHASLDAARGFEVECEGFEFRAGAFDVDGLVGVAVLIGPGALLDRDKFLAELALLGAAVSYAFSGVIGRKFATLGVSAVQSAFGQMCAGAVLMAPLALAVEQPWTGAMPSLTQIEAAIGLSVLSTAAAYLLFFRIMARAGATNVMLVTLLVPPTAMLLRPSGALTAIVPVVVSLVSPTLARPCS